MLSNELSKLIREDVVEMAYLSGCSHVASALSIVDILAVLYSNILNTKNNDIFILSKGHAGTALYSTLARKGYFDPALLKTHYQNGSKLSGHVSHKGINGVSVSTGSLGHGVCMATGFALNYKMDQVKTKVYTIVGDGECNEGSLWESVLFASQYKLDNLTIIVDRNRLQALGETKNIIDTEPLYEKFNSFGFYTIEIDGHNHKELLHAFKSNSNGKPKCIIANTIKGKGVSFMENKLEWHYKNPSKEEYELAIKEIGGDNNA